MGTADILRIPVRIEMSRHSLFRLFLLYVFLYLIIMLFCRTPQLIEQDHPKNLKLEVVC